MRIWLGICAAVALACGVASGAAAETQSVHLTRAAIRLKDGEVWGHWGSWLACNAVIEELKWKAGRDSIDPRRLSVVFDEEQQTAGLMATKSDSLFDEKAEAGLQLGVVIHHIDAQICTASDDGTSATRTYRGKMTMSAEWQVYDPVKAEVVARVETTAVGEQPNRTRDGVDQLMMRAFRENARALLASPAYRHALLGAPTDVALTPLAPVTFAARAPAGRPVSTSASSVATVLAAGGWGSGFLISDDGYMLTNHHVVGDASRVRIRWPDKSESIAEVVRSNKRRDVALLKVDPAGHAALPLRAGAPAAGEAVIAIGTPLDKELQNTVTKGVVSAIRTLDGQSFVQSDVAVDHGNSGGPLLDEQGRVVAITDWGYAPDGVSHNLNFFIPIDDALKVLALVQTAAAEPEPLAAKSALPHKPKR